mmetsp:Transcript_45110/g.115380  ORF Transcript_45110/g.115380 Transcript_45110/m.115380 type:complete len:534 (+) Transcript_45110:717-2318(+)
MRHRPCESDRQVREPRGGLHPAGAAHGLHRPLPRRHHATALHLQHVRCHVRRRCHPGGKLAGRHPAVGSGRSVGLDGGRRGGAALRAGGAAARQLPARPVCHAGLAAGHAGAAGAGRPPVLRHLDDLPVELHPVQRDRRRGERAVRGGVRHLLPAQWPPQLQHRLPARDGVPRAPAAALVHQRPARHPHTGAQQGAAAAGAVPCVCVDRRHLGAAAQGGALPLRGVPSDLPVRLAGAGGGPQGGAPAAAPAAGAAQDGRPPRRRAHLGPPRPRARALRDAHRRSAPLLRRPHQVVPVPALGALRRLQPSDQHLRWQRVAPLPVVLLPAVAQLPNTLHQVRLWRPPPQRVFRRGGRHGRGARRAQRQKPAGRPALRRCGGVRLLCGASGAPRGAGGVVARGGERRLAGAGGAALCGGEPVARALPRALRPLPLPPAQRLDDVRPAPAHAVSPLARRDGGAANATGPNLEQLVAFTGSAWAPCAHLLLSGRGSLSHNQPFPHKQAPGECARDGKPDDATWHAGLPGVPHSGHLHP